ncbi:MAG: sorbosone dehydrogenase family protein [Thiohalomonadales bacterium]
MPPSIPKIFTARDYIATSLISVHRKFLAALGLLVSISATQISTVSAAAPASDTELRLAPVFAEVKLNNPLGMIQAPNDSENWFVLEKKGRLLRVFRNKEGWRSKLLLDISAIVDSSSEGGLLGAAFHPDFDNNRQLLVSYTRRTSAAEIAMDSILSRFYVSKNLQLIDNKTESILLQIPQPFANHNGGQIAFSKQGLLFYGLGDGGSAGDPHKNGQNKKTLLGSMLRIDIDKSAAIAIPSSNLLTGSNDRVNAVRPEIYAWGFRNPWRWSFDRLNGDLWVGDVGQDNWEEVDKVVQGRNYGWNKMEGQHCYNTTNCSTSPFQLPVLEYGHKNGRCSITGGYVYRGKLLPFLYGMYIYGDFCTGEIFGLATRLVAGIGAEKRTLIMSKRDLLLHSKMNISSFAEDRVGEIYVIDYNGHIFKIKSKY